MTEAREDDDLLRDLISYYRARAREYDEWFLRVGRYDHGRELNQLWFQEVDLIRRALAAFGPMGHVLELACGTGLWTEHLLRYADRITALDAVSEVLEINEARLRSSRVRYVQAQMFDWIPSERFDVVFFASWLSHVPQERFADFWRLVDKALKPDGRVFFVDSDYNPTSTASDHCLQEPTATTVSRRLNDGREFRIVKIFYEPSQLMQRLEELGWSLRIAETPNYFIYGSGKRRERD